MKHDEEFGITPEWAFTCACHGQGNAHPIFTVVKSSARQIYFCVGKFKKIF